MADFVFRVVVILYPEVQLILGSFDLLIFFDLLIYIFNDSCVPWPGDYRGYIRLILLLLIIDLQLSARPHDLDR